MQQGLPFSDPTSVAAAHPVVGTQKDIRYYDTRARGVLNSPETTGMDFWSINPYVGCAFGCAYCYARYAHRFAIERAAAAEQATAGADTYTPIADDLATLPPWLAFERRIFVKRNAAEVLQRTLRDGGDRLAAIRRGVPIVIGTATDPYQPAERTFRVTRAVLAVLAAARQLRLVIITKSPLVTRDLDLLVQVAARSRLTVQVSLITLDRELARRIEPRAPTPEARLRAIRRLSAAGIDVGVNVMPVLPGITDRPEALAALVREVAAAGVAHLNVCALRLRRTARKRYLPWIAEEFPQLAARYQATYAAGHQIGDTYRDGLRRFMKRLCHAHGVRYGTPDERAREGRAGAAWERLTERLAGAVGLEPMDGPGAQDLAATVREGRGTEWGAGGDAPPPQLELSLGSAGDDR
jgi:DNA repair photolyase